MSKSSSPKSARIKAAYVAKTALNITGTILIELIEQCEDLSFLRSHRWAGYSKSVRDDRYEYEAGQERYKEYLRQQAIKRLKKNKFIKQRKEGERVVFELTTSGKVKALQGALRSSEYIFDKKHCLVSFDFPEASKNARDSFRYFLKSVGFKYVQGSVWSIKRDISRPMDELIRILKIRSWVKVYIVSE